jgi:excisionase family DNA binding protein
MGCVDRKGSDTSEVLTIEEVAVRLGRPVSTVFELIEHGNLPGHMVDGQWCFHRWVVEEWCRRQATPIVPRVLIVDDDEVVRATITEWLATVQQREVIAAASGEEALAILKTTEVDLVLLDLSLPGLDGVETFRYMQALRPGVPVIIVTGDPDSVLMAQAREIGPLTAISKPIRFAQLHRIVERILEA